MDAVRTSNLNVGGNVLESNGAWLIVRGVGLIQSVGDIERIVVPARSKAGVPIYVRAGCQRSRIGNAFRVASLVKGGRRKPSAASSSRGPESTLRS